VGGVEFKWNRPVNQIIEDATGGEKTLRFIASTWHRLYDPFVPMDTGTLAHDAVDYSIEGDTAIIHHKAPYAHRQYTGEGFNFSKERHPLATAYWDEAAKQAGKAQQLVEETEKYIMQRWGK
jgi:hypothetical protein